MNIDINVATNAKHTTTVLPISRSESKGETPSFYLDTEPWINVQTIEGTQTMISLREAVCNGDKYVKIVGDVPTQSFAIMRLLLAICYRALEVVRPIEEEGLSAFDIWKQWYDNRDERIAEIDSYLAQWHERFNLLDERNPFYQVAQLETTSGEVSDLAKLIPDVPNNEPFFTIRGRNSIESITYAEAARWLIHVQACDTSGIRSGVEGDSRCKNGKGYPIGPGWLGWIGGLSLQGRTLEETLMWNLVPQGVAGLRRDIDKDIPPWERQIGPGPSRPENDNPHGQVDLYTWQSRRVRLISNEAGGISAIILAQGDALQPHNRIDVEPMTAWRYSKPQSQKMKTDVYMPKQHDPSQYFWQGITAIFPRIPKPVITVSKQKKEQYRSSILMQWAEVLIDEGVITESSMGLEAIGVALGSNQAVYDEIFEDTFVFPTLLASGQNNVGTDASDARFILLRSVEKAEEIARCLVKFTVDIMRAKGSSQDAIDARRSSVRDTIYARMDEPFRKWVMSIVNTNDINQWFTAWRDQLFIIASELHDEFIQEMNSQAFVERDYSFGEVAIPINGPLAEARYQSALFKILNKGTYFNREDGQGEDS